MFESVALLEHLALAAVLNHSLWYAAASLHAFHVAGRGSLLGHLLALQRLCPGSMPD
jgi:hypothetical protein